MFISASKDSCAKLYDSDTLECLKTYKTDRPVNSASISPRFDHVVLGGGQEAMDVTTTSTKIGKFDARFFHMVKFTQLMKSRYEQSLALFNVYEILSNLS
jgi:translation initiation factor 3 subunit I